MHVSLCPSLCVCVNASKSACVCLCVCKYGCALKDASRMVRGLGWFRQVPWKIKRPTLFLRVLHLSQKSSS